MNSFNELYTIEELESQGINGQELKQGKTIEYLDKVFVRVSNQPKQFRDLALEERNKYVRSGLDSFVVESRFYLTVWKEQKQRSMIYLEGNPQENHESSDQEAVKPTHILNIKAQAKKYRGSGYSDEIGNNNISDVAQTEDVISPEDSLKEGSLEANKQENQSVSDKVPERVTQILSIKPKVKKYRGSDYI